MKEESEMKFKVEMDVITPIPEQSHENFQA